MKEIFRESSTNGRWGVSIVGDFPDDLRLAAPVRGSIKPLGKVEGHQVFHLLPDEQSNTWVLVGGDLEVIEGATVALAVSLQSNASCTILILGPCAVVKSFGYKRRSTHTTLYANGIAQECPASVLLALGLLPAQDVPVIAPPPPPSSAFADALRRAGLLKEGGIIE